MIPHRETPEKAREFGVPSSTIERDYAQNWLLAHISPITMALKSGTGIRKVFIEHYLGYFCHINIHPKMTHPRFFMPFFVMNK